MKYYEIPFAAIAEIPVQGIEALKTRFVDILEKHSGKILHVEYLGVRDLAYKVKKQSKARFFLVSVEAGTGFPMEITKYFRINESILRYQVYNVESVNKKPSAILTDLLKTPEYLGTEEEKAYSNIFAVKS